MSIIQAIQNTQEGQKAISQSVSLIKFKEHTLVKIDHPTCKAAISLQGAHLLYWQPAITDTPVIWLSEKALFEKETPIRGGIPICWPWFSNAGTPMHGFARIVDWQLASFHENENGIDLVLSLKNNQQTQQYWSHIFELEMKFHLGKTCKAELSCSGDFEATSALHTYFGINDIAAITINGLGDTYHEKLSTVNTPKLTGQMTFDQEVDRIYHEARPETLIQDTNRTIKITHFNYSDVVVWNPWIERAQAMSDLDDNSYHDFVCVETCRISKPIQSSSALKTSYAVNIEVIE